MQNKENKHFTFSPLQGVKLPRLLKFGIVFLSFFLLVSATNVPIRPDGITPPSTMNAKIVLQSSQFDADDWTVVQWKGANDEWHDVTGWQGNFLSDGTVVWWVAEAQLGQQDFRWQVYEDSSRETLRATSAEFDLPSGKSSTVSVLIDG